MNLLNRVGGAFLLLGLGVAVYLGFNTPTGRPFWDGIWQAGAAVVSFARARIGTSDGGGASGHLAVAVAIASVAVIVILTLMKHPVSIRAFTILVILGTVAGFVLYNPAIVR